MHRALWVVLQHGWVAVRHKHGSDKAQSAPRNHLTSSCSQKTLTSGDGRTCTSAPAVCTRHQAPLTLIEHIDCLAL